MCTSGWGIYLPRLKAVCEAPDAPFVVHSHPWQSRTAAPSSPPWRRRAPPTASRRCVPGTLKQPDHMARHPFGRIPVLDHGDFRLYETQAILRYLDRVTTLAARSRRPIPGPPRGWIRR